MATTVIVMRRMGLQREEAALQAWLNSLLAPVKDSVVAQQAALAGRRVTARMRGLLWHLYSRDPLLAATMMRVEARIDANHLRIRDEVPSATSDCISVMMSGQAVCRPCADAEQDQLLWTKSLGSRLLVRRRRRHLVTWASRQRRRRLSARITPSGRDWPWRLSSADQQPVSPQLAPHGRAESWTSSPTVTQISSCMHRAPDTAQAAKVLCRCRRCRG